MKGKEEKKGEEITCPKCGYTWTYKGESEFFISCPRCRSAFKKEDDEE